MEDGSREENATKNREDCKQTGGTQDFPGRSGGYSYPRGNGPHYLMAQLAITSSTWIKRGFFFDGRQEEDPYCKFPPLYLRKTPGKAWRSKSQYFDGVQPEATKRER